MLGFVTRELDPAFYNPARWIGYPAQYAGTMDYEASIGAAIVKAMPIILAQINQGNMVVLLGYSQGAVVARRILAQFGQGVYGPADSFRNKVIGAALVADPVRPPGKNLGNFVAPGSGVAGSEPIWDKAFLLELANPKDIICSAPYNSLIRTFADFTGFFATNPNSLNRWVSDTQKKIQKRGWQNANLDWGQFWLIGQRVAEAVEGLQGYLPTTRRRNPLPWLPDLVINPKGGQHTLYPQAIMPGENKTYCQVLAAELNEAGARRA